MPIAPIAISLIVLCLALFFLVWTLKRLFLGSAKNCIRKATGLNGYLNILVGAGMTIAVQSSSIITSALTPTKADSSKLVSGGGGGQRLEL